MSSNEAGVARQGNGRCGRGSCVERVARKQIYESHVSLEKAITNFDIIPGLKTFGDLNYMGLKLHFWITCVLQAVSSLVDSEEETKVKEKLDADSCCSKRQKVNDDDDDNP
jgi:hypothetical protein